MDAEGRGHRNLRALASFFLSHFGDLATIELKMPFTTDPAQFPRFPRSVCRLPQAFDPSRVDLPAVFFRLLSGMAAGNGMTA